MPQHKELFDIAEENDPERLLEALPLDLDPVRVRNGDGVNLVLFCLYKRLDQNLDPLIERCDSLPLHEAAATGRAERVDEILASGTDAVNTLSTDGWTPLHLASFFGHVRIVEALLSAGADATIYSRAFERNLPLHAACAGPVGSVEVVRLLVNSTPDLDAPQAQGYTPVMIAAAAGRSAIVDVLADAGASLTTRNIGGKDAATLARDGGHPELAERIAARV